MAGAVQSAAQFRESAGRRAGSLNAGELAQRRFREIARVSGLIFQGYPGAPKSTRQLQASSGLFYEVFRKYDAGNLLLGAGRARGAGAGTRHRAPARGADTDAGPADRLSVAFAADPVWFSPDDRAATRTDHHRKTRSAHRADDCGSGACGGCLRQFHTRCCVRRSRTPISCIALVRGRRIDRRVSEGKRVADMQFPSENFFSCISL